MLLKQINLAAPCYLKFTCKNPLKIIKLTLGARRHQRAPPSSNSVHCLLAFVERPPRLLLVQGQPGLRHPRGNPAGSPALPHVVFDVVKKPRVIEILPKCNLAPGWNDMQKERSITCSSCVVYTIHVLPLASG